MKDPDDLSLDAAVTRFQRELPGWWWKIIMSSLTASAETAPESDDSFSINAAREVDERFDTGFSVELCHTAERIYTPAEALLAVLAKAKAARTRLLHPKEKSGKLMRVTAKTLRLLNFIADSALDEDQPRGAWLERDSVR